MKVFDGLFLYEIVLLVLGALMFLVLLYSFVSGWKAGKSVVSLFPFFAISLVMIGYPSIKSIDISSAELKIEKESAELEQNPTDNATRQALSSDVATLSSRPLKDPTVNTTLARAQLALGNTTAAQQNVEKALQASPNLAVAVQLKNRIDLENKLPALTHAVQQDANNTEAKTKLQQAVTDINAKPVANPETMVNIAQAQSALGDNAKAQASVDKALKVNPENTKALQLKKNIALAQHQ
jgi:tetratricopeptide (TPR) repeat protein